MGFFVRFKLAGVEEKKRAVARIVKDSTEDFDFFLFIVLSVLMATFGFKLDSAAVVIGSMMIAPLLSPILTVGLSFVVADMRLLLRSSGSLARSALAVVILSAVASLAIMPGGITFTDQMLSRIEPSFLYMLVAVVSGIAVSYAMAHAHLNMSFPGVAVSVALLPPLVVTGIGVAALDTVVIAGSFTLFVLNVVGIILASVITFSLMGLQTEYVIAESAVRQEERRIKEEKQKVARLNNENKQKNESKKTQP